MILLRFLKLIWVTILCFGTPSLSVAATSKSESQGLSKIFQEHVNPTLERASDSTSVLLWSSALGAYFLARSVDGTLKDQWQDHRQMPESQARLGDHYISYGFNIGIALTQYFLDHDNGVSHARALIFTGAFTEVLKQSFHRQRPDESDHLSFPSGHTSAAFATATSLAMAYGWKVGVPAYSAAVFTGLSRMADNKHWASDVVAGGFLGVIWGRASFFKADSAMSSDQALAFPFYENGMAGLEFSRNF